MGEWISLPGDKKGGRGGRSYARSVRRAARSTLSFLVTHSLSQSVGQTERQGASRSPPHVWSVRMLSSHACKKWAEQSEGSLLLLLRRLPSDLFPLSGQSVQSVGRTRARPSLHRPLPHLAYWLYCRKSSSSTPNDSVRYSSLPFVCLSVCLSLGHSLNDVYGRGFLNKNDGPICGVSGQRGMNAKIAESRQSQLELVCSRRRPSSLRRLPAKSPRENKS